MIEILFFFLLIFTGIACFASGVKHGKSQQLPIGAQVYDFRTKRRLR